MYSMRWTAACGAFAALTGLMLPTGVQAAHFSLSYTVPAGAGQGFAYDYEGQHLEFVYFTLDDRGPLLLSLQQGDSITHSLHFTGGLTLPNNLSTQQVLYWLGLRSSTGDFPTDTVGALGSLRLLYQGVELKSGGPFSSGSAYEVAYGAFFEGGIPIFDEAIADFTVDLLSRPVTVDSSYVMFRTVVPVVPAVPEVPEPAAWTLCLAGLGAVSAFSRRRTSGRPSVAQALHCRRPSDGLALACRMPQPPRVSTGGGQASAQGAPR